MTKLIPALAAALFTSGAAYGTVIVDDSWADGDRANTGPLQANWWSSSSASGSSIEASVGSLGLISGTSGRGIHGTFAPQTLAIGDTLTATFTFTTPTSVTNSPGLGGSFKVALMDFNNAGLAADLNSQSGAGNENPLYVGLPGYMFDLDINTGAAADIQFREHDVTSPLGRFLGTTGEWISLGSSSADAGYTFAGNTVYTGVFSITRTGSDSVDLFSSISQGVTLMDSHTVSDASAIANNFGMLGFWANAGVFGDNTTPGDPNNGIEFSNIKIEITSIPEPSAFVLGALGLALLGLRRRSDGRNA